MNPWIQPIETKSKYMSDGMDEYMPAYIQLKLSKSNQDHKHICTKIFVCLFLATKQLPNHDKGT